MVDDWIMFLYLLNISEILKKKEMCLHPALRRLKELMHVKPLKYGIDITCTVED